MWVSMSVHVPQSTNFGSANLAIAEAMKFHGSNVCRSGDTYSIFHANPITSKEVDSWRWKNLHIF